eukprot:CAMPEP_0184691816 /NCGR_PEP_ID=MMETSP0313-20130426/543_1 /TAXON_ID=2792 /ORGANISM="Porphyridium aerugineum, Strain SAG 1380-2" /LENGTH=58 /DNA_ID=CAMNT_0027149581 /DNA_START=73 /DNA_END=249 /DNA_ORIENTATION=-
MTTTRRFFDWKPWAVALVASYFLFYLPDQRRKAIESKPEMVIDPLPLKTNAKSGGKSV